LHAVVLRRWRLCAEDDDAGRALEQVLPYDGVVDVNSLSAVLNGKGWDVIFEEGYHNYLQRVGSKKAVRACFKVSLRSFYFSLRLRSFMSDSPHTHAHAHTHA
jgi:hypothetical protein